MNLEESDSYKENLEKRDRKRRGVMLTIILCGMMIALLFVMICVLSYKDKITEKFFIDGKQNTKFSSSLYTDINGVTYIDVKKLADELGYTYTKGEYKKYNENSDSCYLQNDFEIVALTSGNTTYDKYIQITAKSTLANIEVVSKNAEGYSENYKLDNPIVYQNDKLYVPLDSLSKMFNIKVDWKEYRKNIYTLENRVKKAQSTITKYKYIEMSGYYENLRAVIDGYVIVGDASEITPKPSSKYYGVFSLTENKELISLKYDDIVYVQNVGEFYIKVENGTMGILGGDGSTIIAPSEFEDISLLDEKKQLYLVKKGTEYGVVNRKGKVLIFAENDKIGLSDTSEFTLEPIENNNLLFGKCIPVEKDDKFGLYNKDGNMILNLLYQGFGYKSTATSKTSGNEQSVLLIPSSVGINGIVINLGDLYGIFDVNRESIILPCSYSKIYAITKNGKTTYYLEYDGQQYDLKEYLEEQGLNYTKEELKKFGNEDSENEDIDEIDAENSNTTVDNETTENNVVEDDEVVVVETN